MASAKDTKSQKAMQPSEYIQKRHQPRHKPIPRPLEHPNECRQKRCAKGKCDKHALDEVHDEQLRRHLVESVFLFEDESLVDGEGKRLDGREEEEYSGKNVGLEDLGRM